MSRTVLRRTVGLSVLLIALSLALGYVHFGGTLALWTGETSNPSSALEAGWIPPPTGLATPTPSGLGANLSWTAAASPATGTQLLTADGGTGASASCGTYGSATAVTSPVTNNTATNGTNGSWWCYEIRSTSTTAWTSSLVTFTPIRVGLYPTAVAISNGGASGTLDGSDTITITFNQNVSSVSGTAICAVAGASGTGAVLIGDSTCSGSGDSTTIGKLTGLTVGGTGAQSVTMSASTATNTVTVTVGAIGPTVSGTGTFTASASVASSAGSATACTSTTAPVCVATATGGF